MLFSPSLSPLTKGVFTDFPPKDVVMVAGPDGGPEVGELGDVDPLVAVLVGLGAVVQRITVLLSTSAQANIII